MTKENLIDLAKDWIEKRSGAYLAKENVIVYYASTTGRKSDYQWITLSLVETIRIIRATLMNPDDSDKLQSKHLIAACQELDRVFEFAVKSRHETRAEVFNYILEAGMSMGDSIVSILADYLLNTGYKAMLLIDVNDIISSISHELNVSIKPTERRDYIERYFTTLGYEIKSDSKRPLYKGTKQTAIMMPSTKPKDLVRIPLATITQHSNEVVRLLK